MHNLKGLETARVGAISLYAIALSAVCFPIARLLPRWASPFSAAMILVAGVSFAPAITCSIYSFFTETPKWVGVNGVLFAAVIVYFERETLYFLEMGLASVPLTLTVMMIIIKRRNRKRGLTIY